MYYVGNADVIRMTTNIYISETECIEWEKYIDNDYEEIAYFLGSDERQKIYNNSYLFLAVEIMKNNDLRNGNIFLPSGKKYKVIDYWVTE